MICYQINKWQLHKYQTVDSTMNCAKLLLKQGMKPDSQHIIIAEQQTQGRGRFDRKWESASGNLMCSLVFQPQMALKYWSQLSFVTSLALHFVIHNLSSGGNVKLKWPNDVMVNGRKIAGILLEIYDQNDCDIWLVIGIGINIVSAPDNTMQPVTYLHEHTLQKYSLDQVLTDFIDYFDKLLLLWKSQGFTTIRQQWLTQAAHLNQLVTVSGNNGSNMVSGRFTDIDEHGRMIMQDSDQKIIIVSAGDVV